MVWGSCVMMCGHIWKPSPTHILSWCGVPVSWCVVKATMEPSAAGNVARKLTEEVLQRDLVGTSFCLVFMSIRRICVCWLVCLRSNTRHILSYHSCRKSLSHKGGIIGAFWVSSPRSYLENCPQIIYVATSSNLWCCSGVRDNLLCSIHPSEALSYMKASVVMLGPTETAQYAGSTSGSKDSWSWVARCAGDPIHSGKIKKEVKAKGCHCGYCTLNQVCSGCM